MEEMRIREEKRAEKEWKQQKMWKRKRKENMQRAMEEKKYFICGEFRHIICYYRNM